MILNRRFSRLFGAMLFASAALAPGCTLLDEVFTGTPFTPEQPVAEVTVQGRINIDPVSESSEGCPAGRALLWGIARNTGDRDLDDVFIEIDALNADNNVIGTYRVNVFNGEIIEGDAEGAVQVTGTSLAVDQSGTFSACTDNSFGSVAGTAYRTDFIVIDEIK